MSHQKDEQEKILHKNFINAQYEYFKYIEPLRIQAIEERIKGKVENPFHWKTQCYKNFLKKNSENYTDNINNGTDKTENCSPNIVNSNEKKQNMMSYKKILLLVHPDKNQDKIQEATKYFQFINKLIDDNNVELLNDIMNSSDIWNKLKDMTEITDSIFIKEKYCEKIRCARWFTWSHIDDEQFITPEQLEELLKNENDKLKKENELLRSIVKMQKESSEFSKKIIDDIDKK